MRLEDWSTLPPACQRVVRDLDSEELIRLYIAYGISGIHAIAGNLWHRHQHQPQVVAPPLVAENIPSRDLPNHKCKHYQQSRRVRSTAIRSGKNIHSSKYPTMQM
jgi:hypothetical protein